MDLVRKGFGENRAIIVSVLATIVAVIIFQAINPFFLSPQGRITLVYSSAYFLIAAVGLTFVMLTGSFDFSVVAQVKLAAMLCALYVDWLGPWVVVVAILVCGLIGVTNGVLTAVLRVPSFLATLAMSVFIEGVALYLSRGFLHVVRDRFLRNLAVRFVGGLPMVFYWALAVWIVAVLVAKYTRFGRRLYALGGNVTAAELSGINVARDRILAFAICGVLAGLAGVLYIGQYGGGSIEMGATMMIPLFASVVAGGTALTGGVGGPQGTILGVIVVTWIQAGLQMLGVASDIQLVVFAIIAILMSIVTVDRSKGSIVT
ncbi:MULTISPECIES: ABC transporter permease [Limnochorda]|uniref:ABC transporter permease n=1 Tax=Limnochorda TaxID=1676651 RepID=UPI0026EF4DCA|nr:ABC transporter permease [Limnochorda pilosa]